MTLNQFAIVSSSQKVLEAVALYHSPHIAIGNWDELERLYSDFPVRRVLVDSEMGAIPQVVSQKFNRTTRVTKFSGISDLAKSIHMEAITTNVLFIGALANSLQMPVFGALRSSCHIPLGFDMRSTASHDEERIKLALKYERVGFEEGVDMVEGQPLSNSLVIVTHSAVLSDDARLVIKKECERIFQEGNGSCSVMFLEGKGEVEEVASAIKEKFSFEEKGHQAPGRGKRKGCGSSKRVA